MEVQGKVVIVTGASSGIGRATARLFAERGASVALAARSADKLEQLAVELREQGHATLVVPTDMRRREEVKTLIETVYGHFGCIDILINNAGQGGSAPLMNIDPNDYLHLIELNLLGPFYAMQAVSPKMRAQGGGLIINVSSTVTKTLYTGVGAYASTKHALNSLSDTARVELAPENIRVVTVFPDVTETDFAKNAIVLQMRPERADGGEFPSPQSPEHVAQKILEAVVNEPAEQYMV